MVTATTLALLRSPVQNDGHDVLASGLPPFLVPPTRCFSVLANTWLPLFSYSRG